MYYLSLPSHPVDNNCRVFVSGNHFISNSECQCFRTLNPGVATLITAAHLQSFLQMYYYKCLPATMQPRLPHNVGQQDQLDLKLPQNRLKHCIQVNMIPGELVAMLEDKLIAGANDKNTALLPGITVCETLAETFPHRLHTADQR
jgi:hypothetical protein